MTAAPVTDTNDDADLISVTYTLSMRKIQYPDLVRAEAQARLKLAAAIAAMDEVDNHTEAGLPVHSLQEQVEVERAKDAYGQAMADLVRGQSSIQTN